MSTPLADAIDRLSLADVWSAVGGGDLLHGRGRAFWRNGDGFNVAIDFQKGLWHDFATGEGGNAVGLVCKALNKTPAGAAKWLIELAGIEDTPLTRASRREHHRAQQDAENARLFSIAAEALAEHCLENDSVFNPTRPDLTTLISSIRGDPVAAFQEWRWEHPKLTRGLVIAGQRELERREIAAALGLFVHAD